MVCFATRAVIEQGLVGSTACLEFFLMCHPFALILPCGLNSISVAVVDTRHVAKFFSLNCVQ